MAPQRPRLNLTDLFFGYDYAYAREHGPYNTTVIHLIPQEAVLPQQLSRDNYPLNLARSLIDLEELGVAH